MARRSELTKSGERSNYCFRLRGHAIQSNGDNVMRRNTKKSVCEGTEGEDSL